MENLELLEKRITLRIYASEHSKLIENCKKSGIKLSEYLRLAINNSNIVIVSKSDKLMLAQLKRIGNNLNQIAKSVNTVKDIETNKRYSVLLSKIEFDIEAIKKLLS
jgi:hypothetical protein